MQEMGLIVEDIRYLLNRGYPKSGVITFVCDHYQLDAQIRYMLKRVIFSRIIAESRRSKTIKCEEMKGEEVLIDGYNILIGVESAIQGEPVYLCDDGFIRDNKGVFRNYRCSQKTEKALDSILEVLFLWRPARIEVLFDSQISKSGELARWMDKKIKKAQINGTARTSKHVDFDLKQCMKLVATADGSIIDELEKVVNVQECILRQLNIQPIVIEGVLL